MNEVVDVHTRGADSDCGLNRICVIAGHKVDDANHCEEITTLYWGNLIFLSQSLTLSSAMADSARREPRVVAAQATSSGRDLRQ